MDARHRIRIIAAAAAVAALTGGRATAGDSPSIPDTELGSAAEGCIAADLQFDGLFRFYDDGLSVLVESITDADTGEVTDPDSCMVMELGLPEWVGYAAFPGVLTFGDWSVMRGEPPTPEGLWIMDNEVAPDS